VGRDTGLTPEQAHIDAETNNKTVVRTGFSVTIRAFLFLPASCEDFVQEVHALKKSIQ